MLARGQGTIVHVSSKAGVVGEPGHAAYGAAKGAVIALAGDGSRAGAGGHPRERGVPGPVVTDMLLASVPAEDERTNGAQAPLQQLGQPVDIAGAVLFLASPTVI